MYLGEFHFLEKVCLPEKIADQYSLAKVQNDAELSAKAALEIQVQNQASAVFLPVIDEFIPRLAGVKIINSFEAGTIFPTTAGKSLNHLERFSFEVNKKGLAPLLDTIKLLKKQDKLIIAKLPDLPWVLSTMISLEEMIRAPRLQAEDFSVWAQRTHRLILEYAHLLDEAGTDYLSIPLTHLPVFGKKYYRQYYLNYYKELIVELSSLKKTKIIVNPDAIKLINLELGLQKENLTAVVDDVKLDGISKINHLNGIVS